MLQIGSPLHLLTLGGCALVVTAFALAGRALRGRPREPLLRRLWIAGMAVVGGTVLTIGFLPRNFDPRYSFPLHLCDVAILVSALSLATLKRPLRAMTYFWALGLSTQAFFTPIVRLGPEHVEYWFFWTLHVQVVGAAVYDLAVHGFRPGARDFATACGATLAYGLVMIPVDLAFDWNYGFLGRDDRMGAGTLLERLPPWPWRLPVMLALALSGMALLWLVWPLARWLGARMERVPGVPGREPRDQDTG